MTTDDDPKRSLRLNSYLIPSLTLILVGLQVFFPFRGWVILLAGFGGMWLIGYLWARALKNGLKLEREMRFGWLQVGDKLQERISLENDSRLPAIWVRVNDHSNLPGYNVSTVSTVRSQWYHHWFTDGLCNQRGIYTLGPTSLETEDPFGIYTVRVDYTATVTMMVVPPVVPLPEIEIAPGARAGESTSTGRGLEQTVSAGGVREYAPGDSLRHFHWSTTARKGEPYVRVFDFTPASDWWVLLDMDPAVQTGQGQHSTEEHGVILAASLVNQGLKMRKAVGLISYGKNLIWHPPANGDSHLWTILRSLATARPNAPPLGKLLAHIRGSLEQRTSLVIITPSLNSEWINSLGLLKRNGVVPTVLLLNPESFGGSENPKPIQENLIALGIRFYTINDELQRRTELKPEDLLRSKIASSRQETLTAQPSTWRRL